jgi:hypothetical protein
MIDRKKKYLDDEIEKKKDENEKKNILIELITYSRF